VSESPRGRGRFGIRFLCAAVVLVAAAWPRLGWCHADDETSNGGVILRDTGIENDVGVLGTPIRRAEEIQREAKELDED